MNRRQFTKSGAGVLLSSSMKGAPAKRSVLEMRYLKLRTGADNQMQRASDFLAKGALPALQRAGGGPVGFFASVIAPESPFILTVAQFPSLAAMETIREKQAADPEYAKAREAYTAGSEPSYQRLESSLLRCFESIPGMEVPPSNQKGSSRIFELRMYESSSTSTLARKIKMFNEGEIAIFRKLGMRPVFFGETLVGSKMPNLTYMLAFDSLAARESAWSAFGSDPEWKELRSKPGNSDAELVSNISNAILRPLPFSPIR